MSLILDALRKMEQERKTRRRAAADLRPEVLRYRGGASDPRPRPYLQVAAGAALLVAGIGAGFFLKGHGDGDRPAAVRQEAVREMQENSAAAPPAAVMVAPAAPLPPKAAETSAPAPAGPAASAVAPSHAKTAPPSSAAAPVSAPSVPAASGGGERVSAPTPAGKAKTRTAAAAGGVRGVAREPVVKMKGSRDDAPVASQGGSDITISGIAFQDERSLRRAVLNGTLVKEGEEVAGARVVEIKETKVRLSRNGRQFDVVFSSSVPQR
ncbi:general secretion pathway protein GspB [Geomonas sp. Red32]|uniref:general secretion pathway protein GspB n=1 Tax=Geomonas sp. Red32 TaxID=2912856 RepID=UPI00202CE086|nr:general secretion pathway protein GspB [Geomonas sp. Red32]MCM0082396.1 general secretion pathway protein GspB [Geomonas sp. Red32]